MNLRKKARDLIELAVDPRTPESERRNAAMKAVKFIRKHDLLAKPQPKNPLEGFLQDNDETVQTVKQTFDAAKTVADGLRKIGIKFQQGRR